MPPVTPADHLDDARRLVERERAADENEPPAVVGARACERLVGALAVYVGREGAHAMFARCLVLCARGRPCLSGAVPWNGSSGWARVRVCLDESDGAASDVSIELVANLIALFTTLVGSRVARQILHQQMPAVFPAVPSE